MASESMEWWLNLQPPAVKKTLIVRTREEAGPMLHMSIDGNIKRFTPYVTRRTGDKENISIPRVSVASSVLGCFIGYCMAFNDVMYPGDNKAYKNGWYVYDIPYEECIRPTVKAVWDVDMSDEHWLVTYNENTRQYKGNIVAKMFYSEMLLKPVMNKYPRRFVKIVIEVMEGKLNFGEGVMLDKGYWEMSGPEPMNVDDWKASHEYTVRKMPAGEYASVKKLTADMLSLPTAMKW